MAVIFPSNNATANGANAPDRAIDATELGRVGPLITPSDLRTGVLFGIPLVSPIVDPITKKPAVMTDEIIARKIRQAIARVELGCGFTITPVQHEFRLPFVPTEYRAFGFIQVPVRPILSVQSLAVKGPSGDAILYNVPLEWISRGQFHRGLMSIIPLNAAFLTPNALPSASAGGVAFLAILGSTGYVAQWWRLQCVAGFDEGKIPDAINDILAVTAAIEILSELSALHTAQSHSISIDGMSQSISLGQVFQARMQQLEEDRKRLEGKLKTLMGLRYFVDNI